MLEVEDVYQPGNVEVGVSYSNQKNPVRVLLVLVTICLICITYS